MIQMNSPFKNRKRVFDVRDFPYGCGTQSKDLRSELISEAVMITRSESGQFLFGTEHSRVGCGVDHDRFKEVDSIMKKAGINNAPRSDFGSGGLVSAKRTLFPSRGSKVKPLNLKESQKLFASQRGRRRLSVSSSNIQRTSPEELSNAVSLRAKRKLPEELSSAVSLRANTHKPTQQGDGRSNQARLNIAPHGDFGSGRLVSAKRKLCSTCESKVSEESRKLIASQRRRRPLSVSSSNIQRNSPEELSNAVSLRANTHKPTRQRDGRRSNQARLIRVTRRNRITEILSPREKVLKALRLFKFVFKELKQDKAARRGVAKSATSRIDYITRTILLRKQVNAEKMVGKVPGIKVGDVFQYKSELNLVGLHFDIMGGIDYMDRGDLKLATSIVSSEGNGYSDIYKSGVLIYTGEGGNVTSSDPNLIEDQKLVRGNLALANSKREKTPVRVIRGETRMDQRGKHYVYDGLYLVKNYWKERGASRNVVFKFELVRISGQPSVDLKR